MLPSHVHRGQCGGRRRYASNWSLLWLRSSEVFLNFKDVKSFLQIWWRFLADRADSPSHIFCFLISQEIYQSISQNISQHRGSPKPPYRRIATAQLPSPSAAIASSSVQWAPRRTAACRWWCAMPSWLRAWESWRRWSRKARATGTQWRPCTRMARVGDGGVWYLGPKIGPKWWSWAESNILIVSWSILILCSTKVSFHHLV